MLLAPLSFSLTTISSLIAAFAVEGAFPEAAFEAICNVRRLNLPTNPDKRRDNGRLGKLQLEDLTAPNKPRED